MKVRLVSKLHFGNLCEEFVEVADDISDSEIEELASDFYWEQTDSEYWWERVAE